MIARHYRDALSRSLARFPVTTVLGPRQCGKTTFLKHALPGWSYVDLERPSDAEPLAADPEGRVRQLGDRIIFDESQRVPALFPLLRSIVDERPSTRGRFVLAGSASPTLVRQVSETLAGRTSFVDMSPLRWEEVSTRRRPRGVSALWLRGGFPSAFLAPSDMDRTLWLEAYTRTFIERDLPALGLDVSAVQMRKLWTMLAHVNGGLWNASQIAASLGVSYHTVNRYVDILEQTFLVRKLAPYAVNLGKRLVKSPKVYFRDSGLLHYFLGIRTLRELETHPARGASWEAFIVDQIVSVYQRDMPDARPYFWRTSQGVEVDLVVERGRRLVPIEVKLHSTPGAADAAALHRSLDLLGARRGYLVYPGVTDYSLGHGVMALGASALLADAARIRDL